MSTVHAADPLTLARREVAREPDNALASSLRKANGSTAAWPRRTASRTCADKASRSRQSHSLRRHASR